MDSGSNDSSWSDVPRGMGELARVVTGRVVLGVAPVAHLIDMGFDASGYRVQPPEWYAEQLVAACFEPQVHQTTGPHGVAFVISTAGPGPAGV